jgi:uncharacterized protein (TIGR00369 family)
MTQSAVAEAPKAFKDLTGFEQLQQVFAGDGPPPGLPTTLDFDHREIAEDRIVIGGTPDERHYNPLGTVHGGYLASLLDSAVGTAVHARLPAGKGYTTLELKVSYLRAVTKATGPIRAEATVTQLGRRAAFAEGRVVDLQGRVYATASTTCLVFDL